jgi:ABC-type transporter Mla subunit MlaD
MAELTAIAAELRRQRRDLDELLENTSTRSANTADLLAKIEELRQRAEATQRRYDERFAMPGEKPR